MGTVVAPQTKSLPIKYLRDFTGGVNLATSQMSVKDNELYWLEGIMPVAEGNLAILPGASSSSTSISLESGKPSLMHTFIINGVVTVFVVWKATGNGYIGTPGGAFTRIFNTGGFPALTSGQTAVCQWNNTGLLIVDPTAGYFDYGVSTAATLTALSNSIQSVTITDAGTGYLAAPTYVLGGPGTGGALTTAIGIAFVPVITAGGAGYAVGDVLTIPCTLGTGGTVTVTTVAAGVITGISLTTRGSIAAIIANPVAALYGSGAGATFTCTYSLVSIVVNAGGRGTGYTGASTITLTGGGPPTRQGTATLNVSGALLGSSVASYAGRAWIGSGRTVTFTDAGSYNTFVGSGSAFTINDQYLTNNITALWVANNYLYIFGDTSIDVLSNVTITAAGVASFSRVNVSAAIGTNQPTSIFSYYRAVYFANANGFYALSGASADKISSNLDLLFPQIDFTQSIYGYNVTINGILCAAFLIKFNDIWTGLYPSQPTAMMCVHFRGRWFFDRQGTTGTSTLVLGAADSAFVQASGNVIAYAFDTDPTKIYTLFSTTSVPFYFMATKLYDFDNPLFSKQITRFSLGFNLATGGTWQDSIILTADNTGNASSGVVSQPGLAAGYKTFYYVSSMTNNAKYIGFVLRNVSGNVNVSNYFWFALEYMETNPWQ
jgi:hypothetical protein